MSKIKLNPWMISAGILCAAFLLQVFVTFGKYIGYDWDIDHMMYYGGRLLHGELVWTKEFDDKLPVVQMIFALPAATESVRTWQLLSVTSIAIAAFFIWLLLRQIFLKDWGLTKYASSMIALVSAGLYLYFCAELPGSISHINPMATSFLILSILLLLAKARRGTLRHAPGTLVFAAFLASIAVSMRPYMLVPALLAGLWASIRASKLGQDNIESSKCNQTSISSILLDLLIWTITMGIIGLALNAGPYVFTGQIKYFLDGLGLLAQKLNPQSTFSVLLYQVYNLSTGRDLFIFVAISWFALLLIFLKHRYWSEVSRVSKIDILFGAVLSPIGLELMILSKHYFPHYQQFFIPYAVLAFAFLVALANKLQWFDIRNTKVARNLGYIAIFALLIAVRSDFVNTLVGLAYNKGVFQSWSTEVAERSAEQDVLKSFFAKRHLDNPEFLDPSDMYLHWSLDQSRHGFPHAAMTYHIFDGWLKNIKKPNYINMPATKDQYCELLNKNGPRFVFDQSDSPVLSCLKNNATSPYKQVALLPVTSGMKFAIFERITK